MLLIGTTFGCGLIHIWCRSEYFQQIGWSGDEGMCAVFFFCFLFFAMAQSKVKTMTVDRNSELMVLMSLGTHCLVL